MPTPNVPRRALLFVNPASQAGSSANLELATAILRDAGVELFTGLSGSAEQLGEQIRERRAEVDCVIIGGGDGSLNAAAAALVETGLPLGILPLGTANDLARTLSIPPDPRAAARIIAEGRALPIDVATVNECHFFNVAHIGLGASTREELSPALKKRLGIASYAGSVFKALRSLRSFHADIICDGRYRRVHSIHIAVGNGRYYGGGNAVAEQARIDDHLFFLYSVSPLRWWQMLRLAPALRRGRFEQRDPVLLERGRAIEVRTRRALRISADGEQVGHAPARFAIRPGAVRVYVPEAYRAWTGAP